MKAPKFEQNKVARLIRVQGVKYVFERPKLDDFKEPTGETEATELKGVFHQTTNHITVVGTDASSVQNKQSPAILALYEDAKGLKQDDVVVINGTKYLVTGLLDIGNWNIVMDISLEAIV